MRKTIFVENEYYHIYNRGVEKRSIFLNDKDRWRFLTLILLFQGNSHADNIGRLVKHVQHLELNIEEFQTALLNRNIELVCFCLMPNHYHLILKEVKKGGISNFGQRLGNGYTKYFNTKYGRTGHLFGGNFQAVHITKDTYLKYLSSYIHNNPKELNFRQENKYEYTWSSFQDYIKTNRWSEFLCPSIILDQFKNSRDYQKYVLESSVKSKPGWDIFID